MIYSGGLSKITRTGREELESDRIESVGDLLDELVLKYGDSFQQFVFPHGKDCFVMPILCNGKFCEAVTTLQDGDRLIFSFIVAGG